VWWRRNDFGVNSREYRCHHVLLVPMCSGGDATLKVRAMAEPDRVHDDVKDIKVRLTSVEEALAGVNRRIDRTEGRLDRIERRLELVSR
jgi:hypothetical protein